MPSISENVEFARSRLRAEDDALVCGQGQYTDDLSFPGEAFGVVLRSPYPAAVIRSVDLSAISGCKGLIGVVLGSDLLEDGIVSIPFMSAVDAPGGGPTRHTGQPPLAIDEVRYAGQPVAFIVAESRFAAQDCAELIEVDYEERLHITEVSAATRGDAPLVDPDVDSNVVAEYRLGDGAACANALAAAAHQTHVGIANNRVIAAALEPRAAISVYDKRSAHWTLYCGNQASHHSRALLAEIFGVDAGNIRLKVMRIGGGFGAKMTPYPEDILVMYAARRYGRPVRWRADRTESFLADYHSRDHRAELTLGFDRDLRITALKIDDCANLGAYPTPFGIPIATTTGNRIVNGVYDIPAVDLRVRTVLSNTVPTGPYRGAGRPEVIHRLELALDAAAATFGIDPAELRRRNLIPADAMPAPVHSGLTYDSGDFRSILDSTLAAADWTGFAGRAAASAARGLLRGRGIACHIDSTSGLSPAETVDVVVDSSGRCEFRSGTQEMGQGLHSSYLHIAADILQLPIAQIDVVQGDTGVVASGVGSYGSRSLMIGGAAIAEAAQSLKAEALRRGAELLEVIDEEVRYEAGVISTLDRSRQIELGAIAAAHTDAVIKVSAEAEAPFSFPNGCYVCEVEIDQQTGRVSIERFTGVDDVGRVLNPMLVHGQMHGGLAQGIGQALLENICYDPDSGQLLTASLLDYALPRADDLPLFDVRCDQSQPATTNPLGVKGAGECGAVGGPPAVVSAIADAIPGVDMSELEMPLTSEKIWRLLAK